MRHLLITVGILLALLVAAGSSSARQTDTSGQADTSKTQQPPGRPKPGTHGGDTGGSGLASPSGGPREPRIAVLEFTNKAKNEWWLQNGARAAQDIFVTELIKSGRFSVIEREKVNAIMREKGLTLSADIDAKTATQIGKLLGVNYILTGELTEYGNTDANAHGPGSGNLPSFGFHEQVFVGALNARVFKVSTGEIVWTDEVHKEERPTTTTVGAFGEGVHDDRMFAKVLKPILAELIASLKASDL